MYQTSPGVFSWAKSSLSGHLLTAAFTESPYHYAYMPVQYTAIFHGRKNDNFQMKNCDIFLIFAQNIDRGYTLELSEAVPTSTNDLCFRAKIRTKMKTPVNPSFSI